MAITDWKTARISLLVVTFTVVLLVVGKSTFYPSVATPAATTFQMPETVPITDWQIKKSTPLKIGDTSQIKVGRKYDYQKNNLALEVEMRYVVGTIGDVAGLAKGNTVLKSSSGKLELANTEKVGFYGILQFQNRLYLSSCINPSGYATVTTDQFRYNRNTSDWNFNRILFWLLGRGNIQDQRCLWTQMSVPLTQTTPQDAKKILENAWISWYQWWQPRFPKP